MRDGNSMRWRLLGDMGFLVVRNIVPNEESKLTPGVPRATLPHDWDGTAGLANWRWLYLGVMNNILPFERATSVMTESAAK